MKLIKNILLSTTALFFISCGGDNTEEAVILNVKSIQIVKSIDTIYSTDAEKEDAFSASVTFEDDSTKDATEFVTWNSSNTNIARVVKGTIYVGTQNGGDTNISISYQDLSSDSIILHSKKLLDYNISLLDAENNATGKYTLKAMGTFEDNTTQEILKNIVYNVNNSAEITIENDITSVTIAIGETNITSTLFNDVTMTKEIIYTAE